MGQAFFKLCQQPQEISQVFEHAILPMLTIVAEAPKKSPLADINIDRMIRILVSLTKFSGLHKNLSFVICSKIDSQPDGVTVNIFSRLLQYLDVPEEDMKAIEKLQEHVTDLLNKVEKSNKSAIKNLQRYQKKLVAIANNTHLTETTHAESTVQENNTDLSAREEEKENVSVTLEKAPDQKRKIHKSNNGTQKPDKTKKRNVVVDNTISSSELELSQSQEPAPEVTVTTENRRKYSNIYYSVHI